MKRHTEDNSPKYRMVGEILSILRSFAVQTRIFAKECNIIAVGYVRSTAQDDENLNRLRNKCAMTDCGHAELVSVSCGLNSSPAFQAPSAQGRQGHTHRLCSAVPFVSLKGRDNNIIFILIQTLRLCVFASRHLTQILSQRTTYVKTHYQNMKYEPTLPQWATCVAKPSH